MKVLVIGSGGREDALVWKLGRSPRVSKIFCAPGNGGIAERATCLPVAVDDADGLLRAVEREGIDLTVVGPEAALAAGVVDRFTAAGRRVVGPTRAAAQLESSKAFSKAFMQRHHIPTAKAVIAKSAQEALAVLDLHPLPVVIKADGLAAGKGVVVTADRDEARDAVRSMMERRAFGAAGDTVLIEECLQGMEATCMAFCDGRSFVMMPAAQDHKRAQDGDRGPNTGGMGAYAPSPFVTQDVLSIVRERVLAPALAGLAAEGTPYRGILYAGMMLTPLGPKVLEFNCRFGDPETQVVLPLLATDLVDVCEAIVEGRLDQTPVRWRDETAVCVVMTAQGYPGDYRKGDAITGLDADREDGAVVFHAGTARDNNRLVTSGGRVLGVTGVGPNVAAARERAYARVRRIRFEGAAYRSDIAMKALAGP
ncbi:MAG: phosphoribosylamine--glycine ligase [Nitrospirota bacterium]